MTDNSYEFKVWAYVEAHCQFPDGEDQYEDVSEPISLGTFETRADAIQAIAHADGEMDSCDRMTPEQEAELLREIFEEDPEGRTE